MTVAGIDLAGSQKNPTGIAFLTVDDGDTVVETVLVHADDDIISLLSVREISLAAIDAPLTFTGSVRRCDEQLRYLGALPPTLAGMRMLAERGATLAARLRGVGITPIEVFATGSAKILGVYAKDDFDAQKKILSLGVCGDPVQRLLIRDELDATYAAFTAFLYVVGQTESVGDEAGKIVVPKI